MPRISIIINNYNYGHLVSRAIDSALLQTSKDTEIVIVDDGSRDNSRAILEGYRDRVKVVLQENRGQAAAINAGVEASQGDVLCFLDADDWFVPAKCSAMATVFEADPGTVLAYHRLQPSLNDGTPILKPIPRTLCRGDISGLMARTGGWWPFPMTSAISVRRSAWDAAGPIPLELRISADAWLVGIFPFLGRVTALPESLGFYCVHGQNNWFREADDPAMLRRKMAHWRATVDLTNRFLAGRADTAPATPELRLADHFPHRIAEARLSGAGPARRVSLALQGLRFGGEPNFPRRIRNALRDVATLPAAGQGLAGTGAS